MSRSFSVAARNRQRVGCLEDGYAMLSLLVALTVTLVILASALPSVQHEVQREREEELFWRGRQIAIALGSYRAIHNRYPLKMEELVKPPEVIGKPLFKLRPSALVDPLTAGEWVSIRQGDARASKFFQVVQASMLQEQKILPPQLRGHWLIPDVSILNPTETPAEPTTPEEPSQNGDGRPIIGVVSRSKKTLIRNYFGIETYDQALILAAFCAPQGTGLDCKLIRMPGANQYFGLPLGELPPGTQPTTGIGLTPPPPPSSAPTRP